MTDVMNVDTLMGRFIEALKQDVSILREICAPDCQLWHSNDNKWMDQAPALERFIAAQESGLIPKFDDARAQATASGFLVQSSMTMPRIGRIHALQLVTVRDGLVRVIEEYIGPEIDFAAQLADS